MSKSPLAEVKERFTDKAGLVKAVKDLAGGELFIDRLNEDTGLDHISNAKLLRLHATLTTVKKEVGSRDKLVAAILAAENRKDEGYKTRLEGLSTPRLWDQLRAAQKRNKTAAPAPAKAEKAEKKAAPAKAAKAAPAKAAKAAKAAPAKAAKAAKKPAKG